VPALLLVLLILVPVAEIWVILQVGEAIGVLPTVALLIADSLLGAALIRGQGRAAWRRLRAALAAGRVPTREAADGALVVLGGALLLAPGFVTDAVGLALLAPPTRALARRALARRISVRGPVRRPRGGRRPFDVDGTAVDVDVPRLP
jgi:UPF0716 protein FxsA